MEIIYETRGKAKEFTPLGVELYTGCSHGCKYCFVPQQLHITPEEFRLNSHAVPDALEKLERDAALLQEQHDDREILLCFHSDPYQGFSKPEQSITKQAIHILKEHNLQFTVLTKGGLRGTEDFDLLRDYKNCSYGTTLIFTDEKASDEWEGSSCKTDFRIEAIKMAKNKNIKTWVNLEPVIYPQQALELIKKCHPIVDYWKIGKLNYHPEIESKVDWVKFREDAETLLDRLGADYCLKKSLTEYEWTEGDIPTRKGNCNVLLIAPHGHPKDDTYSGILTREFANKLDCYAVINEKYQKPSSANVPDADPENFIADLYKQAEANLPQIKPLFLDVIIRFKKEIINKHNFLFIIHVHGIATKNTPKVAKLIKEYEKKPNKLQAIIGYGQWRNKNSKPTADLKKTVQSFISRLKENGLHAALAPTKPIKVDGVDTWYCGRNDDRLNQYLYNSKVAMQTFQIELKNAGVRNTKKNRTKAVNDLAKAIKPFLDSAVQKGTIQKIKAGEINLENDQFMSRLDDITSDRVRFKRLVDSITDDGILNNIIVRKRSDADDKSYQLISGFRRMAALQASISEKAFANATVPARVLDESISDDEAYRFSFTENLARKDLSLWEIAVACDKIKKKLAEGNMNFGEIDSHLANLIQKDARTVRRYLKLASIKNEDIKKAIHTGNISPTDALEIGKKDLGKDDITALLAHIKTFPKTTRSFIRFYNNLEICSKESELSVAEVLTCPNAENFLSLKQKELIARIEYREKISGKSVAEILKGKSGSLVKDINAMNVAAATKTDQDRFVKASKPLSKNVSKAFKKSKIDAQFKIKPTSVSKNDKITVTISAPVDQMHTVMNLASSEISKNVKTLTSQLKENRIRAQQKDVLEGANGRRNIPPSEGKDKFNSKKRSKYQDWVYKTISCCNGCINDCVYCFARGDAVTKKRLKLNDWPSSTIRQHDIDKKYKLFETPVMFPGTHDIYSENFDGCMTVMSKLLSAGNRVLVVSKPRYDIIVEIENQFSKFQDNLLFRFTIGSMDNDILALWEPKHRIMKSEKNPWPIFLGKAIGPQ